MNQDRNPLVIKLIKAYQKNKTTSGHCKFYPTCSNYAIGCYKKFNFFYASLLVGIRILRCNYFARRRYYPVPLSREEKHLQQEINQIKKELGNDFVDYLLSVASITKTKAELYRYIYDYVNLPMHPSTTQKDDVIYASRYLVSNTPIINKEKETLDIGKYLEVAEELYQLGAIKIMPEVADIQPQTGKYLIPLDDLSIEDLLEQSQVTDGIIIINGDCGDISYRDFKIEAFDGSKKSFNKRYRGRDKLILKTHNLKIFPYLEDITYAINLYHSYDEVDYFYSVNKKAS